MKYVTVYLRSGKKTMMIIKSKRSRKLCSMLCSQKLHFVRKASHKSCYTIFFSPTTLNPFIPKNIPLDRQITFIVEYKETALLYTYLQTIQLITQHFTSYSDVYAAKRRGQCFCTVFVQTLLQYLRLIFYSIMVVSILRV